MNDVTFLSDILVLLATAVCVVTLFKRLNLSPVLGYLGAGILIGPYGLAIIHSDKTSAIAEFGVVFLLFAIGLELTFERLKAMRLHVFGFGTAQVLLTTLLIGTLITFALDMEKEAAFIIGAAFALSSTAIVMQVIAEHGYQFSQVGRLSLAVLLLQDFAVVPLLVLVPFLAKGNVDLGVALSNAIINAFLAMIFIFAVGRLLLRPIFRSIGTLNSKELFVATTLLIVLGSAWITEHFGLSLALGAFIAGLLVAETEYQKQVEDDIIPFKGLFLGLFFMTVGMSINMDLIVDKWDEVVIFSVALIVAKALVIIVLCRLFKFPLGSSLHAGLLLAQGGEFAFILFGLAKIPNAEGISLINAELAQLLMVIVTTTMALTPILASLGKALKDVFSEYEFLDDKSVHSELLDLEYHVIIAGFGKVGKMVARLLTTERVPYIALDIDSRRVEENQKEGLPVYHGDVARLDTLYALAVDRASTIILTIDNEVTLRKTLRVLSHNFPELPVIIKAASIQEAENLKHKGAAIVVPSSEEIGMQLASVALQQMGVSIPEISRIKNLLRTEGYIKSS